MFGKRKLTPDKLSTDRVPVYKRVECLGPKCESYQDTACDSRLELLEATGKSGGAAMGPFIEDCGYALYGQVCMAGDEQLVINRVVESPNGRASGAELIGRSGRTDGQRIVLNTPLESIVYIN